VITRDPQATITFDGYYTTLQLILKKKLPRDHPSINMSVLLPDLECDEADIDYIRPHS